MVISRTYTSSCIPKIRRCTSTSMFRSSPTDMTLRVGIRGTIVAGRWSGQTITIEDDSKGTGGYYVHLGPDEQGEQAGDIWLQAQDLQAFADRAGWQIEWSDGS